VLLAGSAEAGLAIVQSEALDGIFLDDRLPQLMVEQCCAEIKASRLNHQTPLILTTSAVAADSLTYARRLGADRVLRKPFRPRDIRLALEGVYY
jgi:CheY-like chemotaxis protein